nr:hypothetical protein [Tanacetum cinerariifolium]
GCDAALETLSTDMEAGEKVDLMKKAYTSGNLKQLHDTMRWSSGLSTWCKKASPPPHAISGLKISLGFMGLPFVASGNLKQLHDTMGWSSGLSTWCKKASPPS